MNVFTALCIRPQQPTDTTRDEEIGIIRPQQPTDTTRDEEIGIIRPQQPTDTTRDEEIGIIDEHYKAMFERNAFTAVTVTEFI